MKTAKMQIPKRTVVWYGLYRKFMCFGSMARELCGIWPDRATAEAAIDKKLEEFRFYDRSEFFVEEVDVTMRAWIP